LYNLLLGFANVLSKNQAITIGLLGENFASNLRPFESFVGFHKDSNKLQANHL
jgi:hypothetical protein